VGGSSLYSAAPNHERLEYLIRSCLTVKRSWWVARFGVMGDAI